MKIPILYWSCPGVRQFCPGLVLGTAVNNLEKTAISKPFWLKSVQQRAIFRQLRFNFWDIKIDEKKILKFENRVEETEHDNDFAFIVFLLQAEGLANGIKERLIGAYRRLEQICLKNEEFSDLVLGNILSYSDEAVVKT